VPTFVTFGVEDDPVDFNADEHCQPNLTRDPHELLR